MFLLFFLHIIFLHLKLAHLKCTLINSLPQSQLYGKVIIENYFQFDTPRWSL